MKNDRLLSKESVLYLKHKFPRKESYTHLYVLTLALFIFLGTSSLHAENSNKAVDDTKKVNMEVIRVVTSYYLENGKFNEAIDYLKAHLQADPRDEESWRVLGLIHFRMKDWKQSIQAFKKAAQLTKGTEKGVNLYYLANAQNMDGDTAESSKTLTELSTFPGFSKAVQQAQLESGRNQQFSKLDIDKEELAQATREKQAKAGTRVAISYTLGRDSNVLLLEDPSIVPGVTSASLFSKPAAQIQIPFQLGGEFFLFNGASSYTHNYTHDAQSYDNIGASIGLDYRFNEGYASKLGLGLYASNDYTWVHMDGMKLLSIGDTVGARLVPLRGKDWSLNLTVPVSYTRYPNATNDDPKFNSDGFAFNPSVSFKHSIYGIFFTETLNNGNQYAKGSNVLFHSIGCSLNVLRELIPFRLSTDGNFSATRSVYSKSEPLRIDLNHSADLNFNIIVNEIRMVFRLTAAFVHNHSTIETGNYRKNVFSLGVTYEAI